MGHITISLEKDAELKLRSIASSKYKNKKGSLAKVISECLHEASKGASRQRAMERQFSWMDSGFQMGKIQVKGRDEIYGR